jgi:serine/threonine protein kinase
LSAKRVPVVRTYDKPLSDEKGIFGFRMERLFEIDLDTAARYIPKIEIAVQDIHRCGVVHRDISPSNLMLNRAGAIVMLDFSRARYDGKELPSYHPNRKIATRRNVFVKDEDNQKLEKVVGMLDPITIKIITFELTAFRYIASQRMPSIARQG